MLPHPARKAKSPDRPLFVYPAESAWRQGVGPDTVTGMKKLLVIVAPHPDDECIIGLLPLRLREECGFEVRVIPATLGSRPERRVARKKELRAACSVLGFKADVPPSAARGMIKAQELSERLDAARPQAVLIPHARDGHATHRAVHKLAVAALDRRPWRAWHVVETEYWHPLVRPNLMVAASAENLGLLCRALACHKGEVARNDYAASLPAWMIDNVRRGAELIGGAGFAAPAFPFATLYRARLRAAGRWTAPFRGGKIIESSAELGELAGLLNPRG